MLRIRHLDVRALVARREVVQLEDAEQVVADLDEHALSGVASLVWMMPCSMPVYPCNRSTYGPSRQQPCYDANTWRSRGGIRCAICSRSTSRSASWSAPTRPGWTPPVDLYETASEFVLTAELPGLAARSDRHPRRRQPRRHPRRARRGPGRDMPCEQFHRVERGHGRFSRAFALPEPIDVEAVTADLKDGVLTVTIPKVTRPRRAPHRRQLTARSP